MTIGLETFIFKTVSLFGWLGKHLFGGHYFYISHSIEKASITNNASWIIDPHRDRLSFFKSGQNGVRSPIVLLFFLCGPSAIFRTIGTIVINSIKRETFSIFEFLSPFIKRFKLGPFIANLNAATAIVLIGLVQFLSTPESHIVPHGVKPRISEAMLEAGMPFAMKVCRHTSAPAVFRAINPMFYSIFWLFSENNVTRCTLLKVVHSIRIELPENKVKLRGEV